MAIQGQLKVICFDVDEKPLGDYIPRYNNFELIYESDRKKQQESPADARVTRDSAVIPRWPSAAILDIIEPEIAPFDPLTPKTLV